MTIPRFQRKAYRKVRQPFILSQCTGWNDDSNNASLLDTDLRVAKNVCFYRADLIGARFGSHRDPYTTALNTGASINGLFDFKANKDAAHRPIVFAGNKIYAEDASADPSVGTDITNAMAMVATQNALWSACVFKDTLIATQRGGTAGTHVPIKIGTSGDAAALGGWFANNRNADYVHTQFNYVFFGGFNRDGSPTSSQNSMNVAYSNLADAESGWDDTRFIEKIGGLSAYGDEYVTGMFAHRDFLMIGTNRRIYPVTYTGNTAGLWAIQRPLDVGLASQHSVVSINGEYTFFMDPQGNIHAVHEVARGFGAIGVQSISRKIKNYVSNWARPMVKYITSAYLPERGWCVWSVPNGSGATAKNELLVLDINDFPLDEPDHRVAKFTRFTGLAANVLCAMSRDTGAVGSASEPTAAGEKFLYWGTTSGFTKRLTDTISYDETDAGAQTPIDTHYETKYFDFGQPDGQKSVVEVRWNMEPAQTTAGPSATILYDFGSRLSNTRVVDMDTGLVANDVLDSTFVLDASRLGSEAGITTSRDYFKSAGTHAALKLVQSISGTRKWKLQQATMVVEMRGDSPESVGAQA